MSEFDSQAFEDQFDAMLADEKPAEAAVPGKVAKVKKEKVAKAPKEPRVKSVEVPNPWGITKLHDTAEVISTTYLRKWAQCSARGFLHNRAANIDTFMTDQWIRENNLVGKTTKEYCAAVMLSPLWIDPATGIHPYTPKEPRVKKEKPVKVKKAKAPEAQPLDEATAAAMSGETPVLY